MTIHPDERPGTGGSASPADPACDVAHGAAGPAQAAKLLVAVFDTPVARLLVRYAADAGYRAVLVEPRQPAGVNSVARALDEHADNADVVVTDHHRAELGTALHDALSAGARWVGIMGNPRHEAPHIAALTRLGASAGTIAQVHRPIGLNIGSRTPAEIAIATLAGLIADRNGRPGGFTF